MASNLHNLLPLLLFLSTILDFPATTKSQECPYPCYPPPTGTGNNPPVATTPPSPPTSTTTPPASFSPPAFITPLAGYFPFTPPSPYSFNGVVPPPPEPILPWFPYYFRRPPHQDQSSSTALQGSRNMIIIFPLLVLVFSSVFL
ncbi:putative Hydroxyproline-rich glycoprotein family protein [Abeliophyllum distichum]|uniref:Hydroxyproline-rich glycoprotein family protein n=1 Tax=Abeliophyllum distichum TaxID=126358 RepID=A0ABD1U2B9_9LAMI